MKGIINTLFIAFAMLGISNAMLGYTWEFANHTQRNLDIKLVLAAGPAQSKIVMADTQESIGWEVGSCCPGHCLQELQYRVIPQGLSWDQMINSNKPWKAMQITWVPNAGLEKILEAVAEIGAGAQSVAIAGAKMGAAAQTGGASELGASAEALKGSAARRVTAQAGQQRARGETTGAIADAAGNADLGGFIQGIGKAISVSNCRGRHFDIVEDEDGVIHFLTTEG